MHSAATVCDVVRVWFVGIIFKCFQKYELFAPNKSHRWTKSSQIYETATFTKGSSLQTPDIYELFKLVRTLWRNISGVKTHANIVGRGMWALTGLRL